MYVGIGLLSTVSPTDIIIIIIILISDNNTKQKITKIAIQSEG